MAQQTLGPGDSSGCDCHAFTGQSLVNTHRRAQELQGISFLPLERVTPDDRAEPTAIADSTDFCKERFIGSGSTIREDEDTTTIKGTLNNMAYAISQRRYRNFLLLNTASAPLPTPL
jgi:hypothetical protein